MRERQNFQKEVNNWDHDEMVSWDVGVFWGQVQLRCNVHQSNVGEPFLWMEQMSISIQWLSGTSSKYSGTCNM